jgi:dephospho-CoA kinase
MIIGVIGGVGSGKSTILDTLKKDYGFVILKTDDIAKSFYVEGNPVFEKLKEILGKDIQKEDGTADLKAIAGQLYGAGKDEVRKKVDETVHPAVWEYIKKEIRSREADFAVETALPNETFIGLCDEIWMVHTETEMRVKRLMDTRGYTEKKAHDMIHSQIGDDEYGKIASFRIDNTGSPEETVEKIRKHMGDVS